MTVKGLLLKIALLASILGAMYTFTLLKTTQGDVDKYYSKFTHKGGSLIVGLSRVHEGIVPEIIEENFSNDIINRPVLNFGFQKSQAPYGDVLLKAIKNKIDTTKHNGLYILSVSPGSFLISKKSSEKNLDKNIMLNRMTDFNKSPNFEYIRKCYGKPLYISFLPKKPSIREIHSDGWMNFKSKIGNYKIKDSHVKLWKKQNLYAFEKVYNYERISDYRISKFKETVSYLKKYGEVILIRMPFDKDFLELENKIWSNFNNDIQQIAEINNIPYFDYSQTNKEYKTYDGSHLFGESAKKFTKQLCDDIKNYPQN